MGSDCTLSPHRPRAAAPPLRSVTVGASALASLVLTSAAPLPDNLFVIGGRDEAIDAVDELPSRCRSYQQLLRFDGRGLPEVLAYSELFGHVEGSFTGAYRPYAGLIARARHGLLVIEYFDDLPATVQRAIRQLADTRMVEPLGAGPRRSVDVKLVVISDGRALRTAAPARH